MHDRHTNAKLSLNDLTFEPMGHGQRYEARVAAVATRLGASKLGYRVIELPPGKCAWPKHHHFVNEEMFFILAGSGVLHKGKETLRVNAGDIVAAPAGGPETAHQIFNDGSEPLRYLTVSTMEQPDVMGYPDSSKFAVFVGAAPGGPKSSRVFEHVGKLDDAVGNWDDE